MSLDSKDIDRMVLQYREDFSPDTEAALRRLHDRIASDRPRLRVVRSPFTYSIAAAVSLLIVAVAAFLLTRDNLTQLVNDSETMVEYRLPDGSRVVLQSGSEISYDAETYAEAERRIMLDGQGYFEIEPDTERPFLVGQGESLLRVTGTAFNLRVDGSEMEVEVSEGSVVLSREGEQLVVGVQECGLARSGSPLEHRAAPNLNHHAWRTGILQFDHTPIEEVLDYFHDNWGYDIRWASGTPCLYSVSGRYSGGDAGAILTDVAKLGGLQLIEVVGESPSFELRGDCAQ
jgi:transmembrane sensor